MNHITDRKLSENLDLTASVRDLKVIRVIFCDHYVATPQELCENIHTFVVVFLSRFSCSQCIVYSMCVRVDCSSCFGSPVCVFLRWAGS